MLRRLKHYKMKYTKNRISRSSRSSRVKHSRKTKYSSSKRKNIRTKIQRSGDLTSEQKLEHLTHLKNYLSYREIDKNSKYIFNKYDLQLIALFIWTNELYALAQTKQLTDFLESQSPPFAILVDILPFLFSAKGQQNYIVVSSSSTKLIEKDYNADNIANWIENPKTDGLILDKDGFLEIINSNKVLNTNGSINIAKLNTLKPELQSAFNYKPLNFNSTTNNTTFGVEPIHETLTTLGLQSMSQMSQIKHSSSPTEDSDILTHMWFKGWPDHGVPDKTTFIKFINTVYKDIKDKGGTTLIHCSAGVGRTGVVYLVLKLMFDHKYNLPNNDYELGKYIDIGITKEEIISELKKAREFRMKLVQTFEQFKFIMGVFNLNLSHITKEEYEKIPKQSDKTTSVGKKCSKTGKNRYTDILPYDDTRVILHTKDNKDECNQYINASHMEPNAFGVDRNVITAQCPTDSTKDDFVNMLFHYKVKRIVMVTNLVEKSVDKCYDYTGQLTTQAITDYTTYYNVFPDRLEKKKNKKNT